MKYFIIILSFILIFPRLTIASTNFGTITTLDQLVDMNSYTGPWLNYFDSDTNFICSNNFAADPGDYVYNTITCNSSLLVNGNFTVMDSPDECSDYTTCSLFSSLDGYTVNLSTPTPTSTVNDVFALYFYVVDGKYFIISCALYLGFLLVYMIQKNVL